MTKLSLTTTGQRPPGQGLSKKARQRRARKNNSDTITIVTPGARQLQNQTKSRKRRGKNSRPAFARNEYLMSLAYPEDGEGSKVPDLTAIPTGTVQTFQENILTTLTDSDGSGRLAVWFSPYEATAAGNGPHVNFATAASSGVFTYNNTLINSWNALQVLYSSYRVVSAVLKVDFIGTTSQDNGVLTGIWNEPTVGIIPASATSAGAPGNANNFLNAPYAESYPFRNGIRILWRPSDNQDVEFLGANSSSNSGRPGIGFCLTGVTPAVSSCHMTLIVNWELIPSVSTVSVIHASSSPVNPSWVNDAMVWGQTVSDKIQPLFNAESPYTKSINQFAASAATNISKRAGQAAGNYLSNILAKKLALY